jgi:hypothetical protein
VLSPKTFLTYQNPTNRSDAPFFANVQSQNSSRQFRGRHQTTSTRSFGRNRVSCIGQAIWALIETHDWEDALGAMLSPVKIQPPKVKTLQHSPRRIALPKRKVCQCDNFDSTPTLEHVEVLRFETDGWPISVDRSTAYGFAFGQAFALANPNNEPMMWAFKKMFRLFRLLDSPYLRSINSPLTQYVLRPDCSASKWLWFTLGTPEWLCQSTH